MKKEEKMDSGKNKKANNLLLKEYIKLQIENILLEDDYDIADDGQQLKGNGQFITTLLGLKGIKDIADVTTGVASTLLNRVFGEAAILVKRLWYTLNPYYWAMSRDELNNIIGSDRQALDSRINTIRGEYADTVKHAEAVLDRLGTDIAVVNFMSNPGAAIGTMAARGATQSAGWIANRFLPSSSPVAAQNNAYRQQINSLKNEAQQQGIQSEIDDILQEQAQPSVVAQNPGQPTLQMRAQELKRQYSEFLNSNEVKQAISNSPIAREGQNALVDTLMQKKTQNITFDQIRQKNPTKFNELTRENPDLFNNQEKKDAFVDFAKQELQKQMRNPQTRQQAMQQIQRLTNQ
jgi:hypothetical protein